MTTTSMSHLPEELAEEILSRVPLKSIKPVRLTCRKWNDLCISHCFRKLHIGRLSKEGETQKVAVIGYNSYLTTIVVDKEEQYIEHKGKLSLLDEQDKISEIFHCEGLLLCILESDSRFLVWNPYLGQTRWIEPRYPQPPHGWDDRFRPFSYALGYEGKSCRSVKLLWFIDNKYYYKQPENKLYRFEIYDFDSDSWTTIAVTPTWRKAFQGLGVSLKGNTYWCATERNIDEQVLADGIICFDFTSERFGPLLPLPFSARLDDCVTLSCVRDEKLAVLVAQNDIHRDKLDIWITTKIEAQEVSWSKFLRVDSGPDYDLNVPTILGSFFIDEEMKVAMAFIEEYDDYPTEFVIIGEAVYLGFDFLGEPVDPKCTPHLCSYVPSLLQIKRKETSKQEEAKGVNGMISLRFTKLNL